MIKIAPSILAGNFAELGQVVRQLHATDAEYIHIDVMDGHFVPNISFGSDMVRSLRPITDKVFDCHLMVESPEAHLEEFARSGADIITFHVECAKHPHRLIQQIKDLGVKAGIALNPGTSVSIVEPLLEDVDLVLQMSVNPGFGGQKFIPSVLTNVKCLRSLKEIYHYPFEIEMDGGINEATIQQCAEAGATVLVAGSAILNEADWSAGIKELRELSYRAQTQ